jgi:hypothetical protein
MKTKQPYLKAEFTTNHSEATNYNGPKELTAYYKLVDKKSEAVVVDCRIYAGRSVSASAVYCSLWVKRKQPWPDGNTRTSGKGTATGYGYDKASAALEAAIDSAGIKLWGAVYVQPADKAVDARALQKNRAHIAGTGAMDAALCAIAHAAGFTDCIFVQG